MEREITTTKLGDALEGVDSVSKAATKFLKYLCRHFQIGIAVLTIHNEGGDYTFSYENKELQSEEDVMSVYPISKGKGRSIGTLSLRIRGNQHIEHLDDLLSILFATLDPLLSQQAPS